MPWTGRAKAESEIKKMAKDLARSADDLTLKKAWAHVPIVTGPPGSLPTKTLHSSPFFFHFYRCFD